MSSSITAVVLSANEYERRFEGVDVLVHRSLIESPAQLLQARLDAIAQVETTHFFFLDDDDDLPEDYLDVLNECLAKGVAMAYTDELIIAPTGTSRVRRSSEYSQAEHLRDPHLVHHLVLCRTVDAQAAAARLPRGNYSPEFLLYWELAKAGAAHVPRIGYVWKQRVDGMHRWPSIGVSVFRARWWGEKDGPASPRVSAALSATVAATTGSTLGEPTRKYMSAADLDAVHQLVLEVGAKTVIEIGVNEGRTAKALLQRVPEIERYIGVDVLPGYVFERTDQAWEVPQKPGRYALDDPRFHLILRERGTFDLQATDLEPCDVIFIDGDHGLAAIEQDTALARQVVRPGGFIVWHDYGTRLLPDVTEALRGMARAGHDIRHVRETLVAFERVGGEFAGARAPHPLPRPLPAPDLSRAAGRDAGVVWGLEAGQLPDAAQLRAFNRSVLLSALDQRPKQDGRG